VADAPHAASLGATGGHFPIPAYLPALVRPVLLWTRHHVTRVAVRYQATLADLWDETLTALLRAAVYYQPQDATTYRSDRYTKPLPDAQSFRYYAKIAVNRACWRYCLRGRRVRLVGLEELPSSPRRAPKTRPSPGRRLAGPGPSASTPRSQPPAATTTPRVASMLPHQPPIASLDVPDALVRCAN
jgi:hypothetical protein